jgi:hypothetical protein
VVIGIGGNDFGFGDIVSTCVQNYLTSLNLGGGTFTYYTYVYTGTRTNWRRFLDFANWRWVAKTVTFTDYRNYCSDDAALTSNFSAANVASITARVTASIRNVALALAMQGYVKSDYTILVQTAPDPIAGSGSIRYPQGPSLSIFSPNFWWLKPRQTVGGCGMWDRDLDWIHNVVLPTLNSSFKQAAVNASNTTVTWASNSYKPKVALLDVQDAFMGRRLCETGTDLLPSPTAGPSWTALGAVNGSEWVSQIRTLTALASDYTLQEGLHPNYWAQLGLRSCVRQAYAQLSATIAVGGSCRRSGSGLDMSKSPPEPGMQWSP